MMLNPKSYIILPDLPYGSGFCVVTEWLKSNLPSAFNFLLSPFMLFLTFIYMYGNDAYSIHICMTMTHTVFILFMVSSSIIFRDFALSIHTIYGFKFALLLVQFVLFTISSSTTHLEFLLFFDCDFFKMILFNFS